MPTGGRHGPKLRRYMRRLDALLEEQQERRRPPTSPPPPINQEHHDLRRQIAELYRTLLDPGDPEGTDSIERYEERFEERINLNPELANVAAELIWLVRQEQGLLAKHGVDYRLYEVYRLE
jgi:hypothetical protein